MAVKLADAYVLFSGDDKPYEKTLKSTEKSTDNWAKNLGSKVNTLATGVIVGGAAAAAAGVVAIGTAAFNVSRDTEQAANDIAASLGIPIEEAERFADISKQVYANNFADDIGDASEAVTYLAQQMGDLNDIDLQNAAEDAFALRDAFGIETTESISAAKTLMENFGISAEEAFDLIAAGNQKGLNRSGDLLDTIEEYSTQLAEGGASADQFFSLLESGLAGGALGTDKAADAFKEFRLRILDGSDATADAVAQLFLSEEAANDFFNAIQSGEITAAQAFEEITTLLGEVEDPMERMQIGAALIGGQFEDLGDTAVTQLSFMRDSFSDVSDATENLNAQYQNFGSFFAGVWRKAAVSLSPVTDRLLEIANESMPLIEKAIESLVPVIERLAINGLIPLVEKIFEWITAFANLSPRMQAIIAGGSALLVAIVPLVSVVGSVIGAFTSLAPILTAAKVALAALGGPVTLVIAAIGGLAYAWSQNLFGIRDATQPVIDTIIGWFSGLTEKLNGFKAFMSGLFQGGELTTGIQNSLGSLGGFKDWFDENLPRIESIVKKILGGIEKFWDAWGDTINDIVKTTFDNIKMVIDTTIETVKDIVTLGLQILNGEWEAAGETLEGIITRIMDTVLDIFQDMVDTVWSIIADTDWSALGTLIIDGLRNGINGAKTLVSTAVSGIVDEIKSKFQNIDLNAVGRSMINGLRNGMSEAWTGLRGWFQGQIDSLVNLVPSWLRPGSSEPAPEEPTSRRGTLSNISNNVSTTAEAISRQVNSAAEAIARPLTPALATVAAGDTYNITINASVETEDDWRAIARSVLDEMQVMKRR